MYPPRKPFPPSLDRAGIELLLLAYMAEHQVEPVVWQDGFRPFAGDCIEEYLGLTSRGPIENDDAAKNFPMIAARGDKPYDGCIDEYYCISSSCRPRNIICCTHSPLTFLPWPDRTDTKSTT